MAERSKRKILVLLFNNFANDSRVLKECAALAESGYAVEVWADHDPNLPGVEERNGFVVKRLFWPTQGGGRDAGRWPVRLKALLKRTLLMVSPGIYKRARNVRDGLRRPGFDDQVLKLSTNSDEFGDATFDAVHCNDLPTLPLAVSMKKKYPQLRIVYDAHEYETETNGLQQCPKKKAALEKLERDCIPFVDEMITISPSIGQAYKTRYALSHVHLVRNCPPIEEGCKPTQYLRQKFKLADDDIIFLYQGGLKANRGIEEIFQCFSDLRAEGFQKHHVVFLGYGKYAERVQSQAQREPNVHFHPAVSPTDLLQTSASADYGLMFIPNNCKSHDLTLPNKLFEYMASGLPTVTSPLHDIKKVVEEEGVGFVTSDFEAASLLTTLKGISHRPDEETRRSLRDLHKRKYNWDIEKEVLLGLYRKLLS